MIFWQHPASLVGFDPTLLICEKKRGVEPPRRSCPKEPLERGSSGLFPKQKGPRSLWHPGAARYGHLTSRALFRTFERLLVGGTTNLEDPTWRKANFLWKFLCAGGAFPTAAGTPSPPQSPRKDFCRAKMPCGGEDCQICCSAVWSLNILQTGMQLQTRKRVLTKTVEAPDREGIA